MQRSASFPLLMQTSSMYLFMCMFHSPGLTSCQVVQIRMYVRVRTRLSYSSYDIQSVWDANALLGRNPSAVTLFYKSMHINMIYVLLHAEFQPSSSEPLVILDTSQDWRFMKHVCCVPSLLAGLPTLPLAICCQASSRAFLCWCSFADCRGVQHWEVGQRTDLYPQGNLTLVV
jgi:hypothetical protein